MLPNDYPDAACRHEHWTFLFEYSPDFHDKFLVFHCPACGGHFLMNNWERVDWQDGRDTQHASLVRLTNEQLAEQRRLAQIYGA